MRERRSESFIPTLNRPDPHPRVRLRVVSPDLLYGFGASALLTAAIFVFHLPQWQTALGGGVLALWFISMALARMQRNLLPPRNEAGHIRTADFIRERDSVPTGLPLDREPPGR